MALLKRIADSEFGKKVAAPGMMALGLLAMPFNAANAGQIISPSHPISVHCRSVNKTGTYDNFLDSSAAWSVCKDNHDGIAVTVMLGTDPRNPSLERIENRLRQEAEKVGVHKVAFFAEQGDQPVTTMAFMHRGNPLGDIYPITTAKDNFIEWAKFVKTDNDLFASTGNDFAQNLR